MKARQIIAAALRSGDTARKPRYCHKAAVIRTGSGIASRPGDGRVIFAAALRRIVRRISSDAAGDSLGWPRHQYGVLMADHSMTGTFRFELPKDLLSEAQRAATKPQDDLRIEGWRRSWLSRISEKLVGED